MIAGGAAPTGSVYVGGVYDVEFGQAYVSYCETSYNYEGEYFEYLDLGGSAYTANYATTNYNADNAHAVNCWADSSFTVDVIDYMPASATQYVGIVQIYEQAVFSF